MLQDLLFAELAFELQRQCSLLQFPGDGAVLAEKNCPRELLRDRAGTFAHGSLLNIGHDRSGNAPAVHAVMVIEATVLSRDEGLLHQKRHGSRLDFLPRRRPQFLDHLAVRRQ